MKKKLIIVAVGALVICGLLLSSGALAGKSDNGMTKGNGMPSGQHYDLNIIGAKNESVVGNNKNVGDSMGHTMFVDLYGKTKIIMFQDRENAEFKVVDRNGLDDGEANFSIGPGTYNIYARALGKPSRYVNITAWGEFEELDTTKLLWLGYVKLTREKGKKPQSVNINELFYVDVEICTAVDPVTGACTEKIVYEEFWVFDIPELIEYYWDYDNHGLKLLQVRFYECTLDPTGAADDFCRWGDGTPIDSKKTVI